MNTFSLLYHRFADFLNRDEEGTVTIETVLIFPLLMWTIMVTYVSFDGFRAKNTNVKAAYTVTDMLSRELNCINDDYLDASQRMLNFLSSSAHDVKLRVSVIEFDEDDDAYKKAWSEHRGGNWSDHTDASINDLSHRIPVLPPDDQLIMVETRMAFEPIFSVGIGVVDMQNFVVSRPRAGQLYWCDDIL